MIAQCASESEELFAKRTMTISAMFRVTPSSTLQRWKHASSRIHEFEKRDGDCPALFQDMSDIHKGRLRLNEH